MPVQMSSHRSAVPPVHHSVCVCETFVSSFCSMHRSLQFFYPEDMVTSLKANQKVVQGKSGSLGGDCD